MKSGAPRCRHTWGYLIQACWSAEASRPECELGVSQQGRQKGESTMQRESAEARQELREEAGAWEARGKGELEAGVAMEGGGKQ